MKEATRILIVEDKPADADLAKHTIQKVLKDCEFQVVETRTDFLNSLEVFQPDVILSDYNLPRFDGMKALKLALEHAPLIPFIIWTGSISEDVAVECMKAGANNYILKENIKRLEPAVVHALEERKLRLERTQAEEALQNNEKRFRALIENGLDNISLLKADGTLIWESPAANRTLGYEQDQFVGRDIFSLMHPSDLAWTRGLYEKLIHEPGSHQRGTFRLRRSDGTWRWVDAIVTNMLNEPSVNAIVVNYRDITEQKVAEEASRESQAKYQNLVETSHDLIWSVDAEGKITFLNHAAKEIYGYEPEDLIGLSFFEIMDPGHYHQDSKMFKEAIVQQDEFRGVESHVRHKDGREFILSANSIAIRDDDNNVIGITGSSHDITEWKQMEEALREERNLLRTLIDNIPDRIYGMDLQGRKTLSNTADWKASGGTTMEDVIGKTDFDTYPPELAQGFWQLDKVVLDSGQPVINFEEPGLDFEGNLVSILTTKIPLRDDEGKVIGLVGIGRDITDRKQVEENLRYSENRYRLVTKATNDVIWEWNPKSHQLLWSENAQYVFGYPPEEIGPEEKWWDDHIHPDDRKWVLPKLNALILGNESIWMEEYRFLLKDGSYAYISDRAYIERDENGEPLRMIGAMSNITSRKESEIERQALLEIMQGLTNTTDLQELLELIHHSIAKVIYARNFFVILHNDQDGLFEEIYSVDQYDPPAPPAKLEKSITSYVFRSGEPLLLTQERFDELAEQGEVTLVGTNSASWLGVPLKTSGRTIGIIAVQDYENYNRYSERDKEFLASIASQIALAINHKQAVEAVRESEMRYRGLFENLIIGFALHEIVTDDNAQPVDYVFLEINPAFEKLTGINAHQAIGKSVKEVMPGIENDRFIQIYGQVALTGTPVHFEEFSEQLGKHYEITAYSPKRGQFAVTFTDITERKQATIELQQKNDDLGLLHAINQAVIRGQNLDSIIELLAKELQSIFSTQGSTIYSTVYMLAPDKQSLIMQQYYFSPEVEHKIEKMIGSTIPRIELPIKEGGYFHTAMTARRSAITSGPQAIQKWITEFTETKFLHPFARKAIRKLVPQIYKLLKINSTIVVPLISQEEIIGFWDVSGSGIFTADDLKRVENIGGQLTAVIQRQQANEKIRRSEEFLQSIQNALSASIAILNETGTIVQVNSAWREFGKQNGVAHPENCVGLNYLEICDSATGSDADEAPIVARAIRDVIAGSKNEALVEYPCHSPTQKRWFTLRITKFENEEGKWVILAHENITERKHAENALHNSEALYRQAMEVAGAVPYYESYYDEGRLIKYEFIGEGIRQITGYGPEEFNATIWDSLVEEVNLVEDLAGYSLDEGIQRVRAGENSIWKCEHRLRDRDGKIHWVFEAAVELRDENGISHGSIGTYQDITTRKQAIDSEHEQRTLAEALRDTAETLSSSLSYEEVLDHILAAVGRVVPHDAATITLINGEVAQVVRSYGYDNRGFDVEIMGIKLPLAETNNLRQMLETRQPVIVYDTHSYPGWTRLESTDWLRSNVGAPISIQGKVIGFILLDGQTPGFFTPVHAERLEAFANQAALAIHNARLLQQAQEEITERKRAEEALRAEREKAQKYLDIAGVIMLALDEDGIVTLINQKGCEILGYSAHEIIGKNWINTFLPEANREELQMVFRKLMSDFQPVGYYENPIVTKSGEERLIAWHNTLVSDEQGRIINTLSSGEDITERKQAEAQLRASEERFRQLADNIREIFWMTDAESGKEIYMSPAVEAIWGRSVENLMSEPNAFIESIFPEDQPAVLQAIEKEKNGEKVDIEYRIIQPNGSIRWVWDRAFPIFDDTGKVERIAGITADITERRESETALIKSQSRYRELFDSSPISIWEEDYSLVKKQIDRLLEDGITNLKEYLSIHPDEVTKLASLVKVTDINKVSLELYQAEHKEDLLNSLTQVMDNEPLSHFEEEILGLIGPLNRFIWEGADKTINGRQMEVIVNGSIPEGYEEDWSKVIVSIIDITERRQAEQQLRKLSRAVEQSASTIVITDTTGNIEYVNPKFTEVTGYSTEEVIGQNPRILKSGFTSDEVYKQLWQTVTSGKEWHGELLNRKKNDELYWEYVTVSPILNERGEITHFVGVKEDITERKHTEEEIRRRVEETSALLETSLALTKLDLKATLQTIGKSAKTLFAADGCRVFLTEPDGESLHCVMALQENSIAFSNLSVKVGEGVTGAVAASGQAEIVNDMQNDPRSVQVPNTQEKEQEAIMFAPLKERDYTIGVLSIRRAGAERPFQPADLGLLEAFASMAASAVSNARLFEETQRRLAQLEALYENGLAVGRLLKTNEIGDRLINTFAHYLQWHHVTVRLRQEESDDLELVAFNLPDLKGEERAEMENHFTALINKVGQGLSGWVIQTGIPFRTGNVHNCPQYIDTHAGIQSGLYMPLKVGERMIGVISVESETPDAFTEQDERLLATLANQAAIAFENARLYEAIQKELSERNRAEHALRTSEVHYRELADSITDILFELDQDLHYTHWNKASETLTGVPAKDAIGKPMYEIFGESEEQIRISQIYESVLKNRQPRTFETTLSVNGQKGSFEINAYPSTRGVSVVAKDVTERKRSEIIMQKRFELMEFSARHSLDELLQKTIDEVSELTDSSIGFLNFVNEDQTALGMQTWSTSATQLFQVAGSEGEQFPLDQAGVWAEAVRQRHPLIQNDYESLSKRNGLTQGHVPITRELVIPIIRNERIMAIMGIANKSQDYKQYDLEIAARLADYAWDIMERKQMELTLEVERNQLAQRVDERTADLSRANSNLARALRVKDEFLANMSHELRTPLNAILGLSESLSEQIAGPLNEKQQKYISTISESGHHLLSLINDILDLAKIDAGQITLDINKVDVHSVCQASLRMIKQLAQKKNQEVALEIDEGLRLMWADERRLKQMLVNLLGNAVKFTPENGRLGLEVHGDEEANKISFTVWDKGVGIKEEDLARLFQPFVQLDSGLARETTGTGLGLALVAQMARLHGGSIQAVSEPETGSRFTVVLPWEPALAIDAATRMKITGKFRAIKLDEKNKPIILVVEDTQEVTMLIKDYLELAGYKVVTAQDGVDAIVQAKLIRPDLILMDVQMPRMDGLEATRKLRSEPDFRYTPIIALTALAMSGDRERCLEAGMDEYISKPVNLKALIKIIQGCLFSNQELKSR